MGGQGGATQENVVEGMDDGGERDGREDQGGGGGGQSRPESTSVLQKSILK